MATVGINVTAITSQATAALAKLKQDLGKFAQGGGKALFGGQSNQQAQQYARHLQNIERSLERVTMRVKTLQGAQKALYDQQRQMNNAGVNPQSAAALQLNKSIHQNQRSLNFWQAKQMGVAAQQTYAQANRPGIGGGGGGAAGWLVSQGQSLAGGLGGPALKALGLGALTGGAAALIGKAFMAALDEHKEFADVMPKLRGGNIGGSHVGGFMNNFRNKSLPFGYSGLEALKIAGAMAPGSSNAGIQKDSQTAMAMGRMFGMDAGGQASLLAEGGKLGAFKPGDARRFAEMLAREIGKNNPRAQEMQEATLSLLQQQVAGSGTANPAAAMAMQTVLAKTGIPGLQGQMGASLISHMNQTFGGAEDDRTIAFQEGMLRDQRGTRGYYAMRRAKERIQYGKDPRYLGDAVTQAYQTTHGSDNLAKDMLSQMLGVPLIMLDEIGSHMKGGLRGGLTAKKLMAGQGWLNRAQSNNAIMAGGLDAMKLPGNEARQIEAAFINAMARGGNPLVKGLADLGVAAVKQLQKLNEIADSSKSLEQKVALSVGMGMGLLGFDPKTSAAAGKRMGKLVGPAVRGAQSAWKFGHDPKETSSDKINGWLLRQGIQTFGPQFPNNVPEFILPHKSSHGVPFIQPSAHAPGKQSSNDLHLHVHFDPHGALHPQVKHQFMAMMEEAAGDLHRKNMKAGLHRRYSRIA